MPVTYSNNSKTTGSAVYPLECIGSNDATNRVGPLVTPRQIRDQYLFGIPLVAYLTKQPLLDESIQDFINRALNEAEMSLGITIMETMRFTRAPYDKAQSNYFAYIELPYKPVTLIDKWSVQSANGSDIYIFPASLIETGNAAFGQLSLGFSTIPANSPVIVDGQYGSSSYLLIQQLANYSMPGFYSINYRTGFPSDKIPLPINELVATIATLAILSLLGPLNRVNSSSLGIDGLNQASSGPGVRFLELRMNDLMAKKENLITQIRSYYYTGFMVSNI